MPKPTIHRPVVPQRTPRRAPRPRSLKLAIASLVVTLLILVIKVLPYTPNW